MTGIAGPVTDSHPVEACYGSRLHCFWHEADEPPDPARPVALYPKAGEDAQVWCYECHHLHPGNAALLAEHNKALAALGCPPETDAARVTCCPFCTHDW